jgi:hypothetical protein
VALLEPRKRYRSRRTGELMSLLTAGVLLIDYTLVYIKHNGEVHRGVVTNDGWIRGPRTNMPVSVASDQQRSASMPLLSAS